MSEIQSVAQVQGVGHAVTIIVDDEPRQIRAGSWVVRELKAALGIDPAKVLAEITPQGLKDLPDDGKVAVHEGAKFMTHVRSGGSS
ncbi:MAG: hypothetical protein EPO20_20340 [Betaproteobacteria bacterium]|nr:MAG: hypothetical protein EPO20_20340 [Betaproteobacteria bacterium]